MAEKWYYCSILVGLIFVLSCFGPGVSHLLIAAYSISSARRRKQRRAVPELQPSSSSSYVHNVSHPHHVSMLQIWSTLVSMDNKWLTSVPKSPVFRRACPSRRAFVENRPSNARLFVILPVFLWFSAHSERYWAIWQTGQQRSEPALNHKRTTKSQKLGVSSVFAPV